MIREFIARTFSGRVRQLERDLEVTRRDYAAVLGETWGEHSLTQMTFTPETGLQCQFEGNFAKLLAAWAMNTLTVVDAKNYVEFQVRGPTTDGAPILITVQRVKGETPGAKAARLEAELATMKAA